MNCWLENYTSKYMCFFAPCRKTLCLLFLILWCILSARRNKNDWKVACLKNFGFTNCLEKSCTGMSAMMLKKMSIVNSILYQILQHFFHLELQNYYFIIIREFIILMIARHKILWFVNFFRIRLQRFLPIAKFQFYERNFRKKILVVNQLLTIL